MSGPLERFQAEHGAAWAATTQSPSFIAAFTMSNLEKLQAIVALTDEEIAQHGQIILADLRGHLRYETALISLHEKKEFVFQDMPAESYPDPAQEAAEEEARRQNQSSETANAAISFSASEFSSTSIKQKQKPTRGKRRKTK